MPKKNVSADHTPIQYHSGITIRGSYHMASVSSIAVEVIATDLNGRFIAAARSRRPLNSRPAQHAFNETMDQVRAVMETAAEQPALCVRATMRAALDA